MEVLGGYPAIVRLTISIVLTVGISLLFVWAFHKQAVSLVYVKQPTEQDPPRNGDPEELYEPGKTVDLAGRVIAIVMFAFVFLLAFTIGQFWNNVNQALDATQTESADYSRAMILAKALPADKGRDTLVTALEEYRTAVIQVEWPFLQAGDSDGAYRARTANGEMLAKQLRQASDAGAFSVQGESDLSSSIDDMLSDGTDRINALPDRSTTGLIYIIGFLAVMTLAVIGAFQLARLSMRLLLIGIAAAVVGALMFTLVELSNPYDGAEAVVPLLVTTTL